jgi:hypothetical protein
LVDADFCREVENAVDTPDRRGDGRPITHVVGHEFDSVEGRCDAPGSVHMLDKRVQCPNPVSGSGEFRR